MISLLPIGGIDRALLEDLSEYLSRRLRVPCSIQLNAMQVNLAFNSQRRQYHSTEILKLIANHALNGAVRALGVTEFDLYIPVLTIVFGEAQLGRGAGIVSAHRLRQEFYGLPADPDLLRERVLKEFLHELGHTYGLRHCPDYSCVMSSSTSVERIDLKRAEFCLSACARILDGRDR